MAQEEIQKLITAKQYDVDNLKNKRDAELKSSRDMAIKNGKTKEEAEKLTEEELAKDYGLDYDSLTKYNNQISKAEEELKDLQTQLDSMKQSANAANQDGKKGDGDNSNKTQPDNSNKTGEGAKK